jgi:formamidopyrimidine-DNA glycosylase
MPELPEVEHARRLLSAWASGRRLTAVAIADPAVVRVALSSRPSDAVADPHTALSPLVGASAGELLRRGKRLGWRFDRSALLIHFGMSGRWARRAPADEPPRFGRLGLVFGDVTCWFVDTRRFGCVTLISGSDLDAGLVEGLGPDAHVGLPEPAALAARFKGKKPIKLALLEQERLAGLGNIHAVEALWRAKINPNRRCDQVSGPDWSRLREGIAAQLGGAIDDFAGEAEVTYLSEGAENNPFAVYDREGKPCLACGAGIVREVTGARSTYWCPRCQPAA